MVFLSGWLRITNYSLVWKITLAAMNTSLMLITLLQKNWLMEALQVHIITHLSMNLWCHPWWLHLKNLAQEELYLMLHLVNFPLTQIHRISHTCLMNIASPFQRLMTCRGLFLILVRVVFFGSKTCLASSFSCRLTPRTTTRLVLCGEASYSSSLLLFGDAGTPAWTANGSRT